MFRVTKYLGLFLVSTLLAGCYSYEVVDVNNVKSDAINQSYGAYYDAEDNRTRFGATFRVGGKTGSTLDLTGTSAVECNGHRLGPGTFIGRQYGFEIPGHAADCEFVFTDSEGTRRVNTIRLGRTEFADDSPEAFSRSKNHTIAFDGPPLAEGEIVELKIVIVKDSKDGADAGKGLDAIRDDSPGSLEKSRERLKSETVLGRSSKVGGTSVEVRTEVLNRIDNGPISVQWTRTVEHELQDATPAGGRMRGHYRSSLGRITLTD